MTDKEIEKFIEQGLCPYCDIPLIEDIRFTEEAWGIPKQKYEVKMCINCGMEVGDYYR